MTLLGCTFDKTQVGMFLWGKIPEKYADVEQLSRCVCCHEARVFICARLSFFGSNGRRYVRISLCAKDELMMKARDRIASLEW